MAIDVKEPTRKFFLKKGNQTVELADVAPHLPVADILEVHMRQHPELVNATIGQPKWENDEVHYHFDTAAGVKG
jgi:PRTRC genetic system protein C